MPKQPKKRKPGRPKLAEYEAKGKIVPVRFTAGETEQVQEAANECNQTVSEWTRNAVRRELKMTNLEKIGYFLAFNHGMSFCDDCLADKCHITNRRTVQAITHGFEFNPHFKRYEGECHTCTAKLKKVTCALPSIAMTMSNAESVA